MFDNIQLFNTLQTPMIRYTRYTTFSHTCTVPQTPTWSI